MQKKTPWWIFLLAIPVLIALRVTGMVGNGWLAVGIVSIGAGVAALQLIVSPKLNILSRIFIVWTVIFIGLPLVKTAVMKNTPPLTKEAVEEQGAWKDLQGSEKIRPHELPGMAVYRRFADQMQNQAREHFVKQFANLEKAFRKGKLTYNQMLQADAILRQEIEETIKWRKEASNFIQLKSSPSEPSFWEKAWSKAQAADPDRMSAGAKLFLLALGLLVSGLILFRILPKTADGKRKVGWIAGFCLSMGGLALFSALVVGLFGTEVKASVEKGAAIGQKVFEKKPQAPPEKTSPPAPKIEPQGHRKRQIQEGIFELEPFEVVPTEMKYEADDEIRFHQTAESFTLINKNIQSYEVRQKTYCFTGVSPASLEIMNGASKNKIRATVIPKGGVTVAPPQS